MIRLCRTMSWISIATFPSLMVLMSIPAVMDSMMSTPVLSFAFNLLGAASAGATLIPWPLAIIHWRRRHPPHTHWILWGIVVLFGVVVGAWAYWILATKEYERVDAAAKTSPGDPLAGAS